MPPIETVAEKSQITLEADSLNFAEEAIRSGMEVSAQVQNTAGSNFDNTRQTSITAVINEVQNMDKDDAVREKLGIDVEYNAE